ncbi:MAG: branched-chain amino acid ABC transporter permease [Alphaproteobacteria bacterium]|nr:branched-chain amino acid ABC transporter permease [Alphaproteobacteria bacterium]
MLTNRRFVAVASFLVLLALVPLLARFVGGEAFWIKFATRVMIYAIAAVSLDLILGFGGMVSFGHAAFLGVGAYAVGILSAEGIANGFVQWPVAILASALIAAAIGAISLMTRGVYFIMITLAFSQMLYFLGVSLTAYGGDDGMRLANRSRFPGLIDLSGDVTFFYVVLAILIGALVAGHRLVNSRFGMVIQGCRSNERRMRAIGFPTFRYKLAAFVISGVMCGIAGALLANLTAFVSPSEMHWTRSGEIMVMVIMGGMGSLFGPVLGAAGLLVLEEILSSHTQHWQAILGPILVLLVLFAKRGLFGLIDGKSAEKPAGLTGHG